MSIFKVSSLWGLLLVIVTGLFILGASLNTIRLHSELDDAQEELVQIKETVKYNFPPPVIISDSWIVRTTEDTVFIGIEAERKKDCRIVASVQWRDEDGIILGQFPNKNTVVLAPNQPSVFILKISKPVEFSEDRYYVMPIGTYYCTYQIEREVNTEEGIVKVEDIVAVTHIVRVPEVFADFSLTE